MDTPVFEHAQFYFDDTGLNILYLDQERKPRSISMALTPDESEIVQTVLSDVNFWSQIAGALSAALTQHK